MRLAVKLSRAGESIVGRVPPRVAQNELAAYQVKACPRGKINGL
jgi:hypothetical protein